MTNKLRLLQPIVFCFMMLQLSNSVRLLLIKQKQICYMVHCVSLGPTYLLSVWCFREIVCHQFLLVETFFLFSHVSCHCSCWQPGSSIYFKHTRMMCGSFAATFASNTITLVISGRQSSVLNAFFEWMDIIHCLNERSFKKTKRDCCGCLVEALMFCM